MTILVNTYEASGTTQAVTVPYQSKPFLGFIFVQAANFSLGSTSVVPGWGLPPASSGAGGAAGVYVKAFDDPTDPSDPALSVTVAVTTGPILIIAMSVSSDEPGYWNISYHDIQTGTAWSGALVPATGTVKETAPFWSASDIDVIGFVTSFLSNTVAGTVTVTPTAPLTEIAEVDATTVAWAIEVCHEPNPPGTDRTVTVSGTSSGGTRRIDGAVFTFHIAATFVRNPGGWHIGKTARGAW